MPKRSENAKAVARKVMEKVQKGAKVDLGDIIREQGYSEGIATHPSKVTKTKSYREEAEPFVRQLIAKRQKFIDAISDEKIEAERAQALTVMTDIFTKNIQLLSGEDTDRHGLTINLISYKNDDNNPT